MDLYQKNLHEVDKHLKINDCSSKNPTTFSRLKNITKMALLPPTSAQTVAGPLSITRFLRALYPENEI